MISKHLFLWALRNEELDKSHIEEGTDNGIAGKHVSAVHGLMQRHIKAKSVLERNRQ